MKPSLSFKIVVGGLLTINLMNWLAPIMASSANPVLQWLAVGFYFVLDPACHQLPERSFYINGLPMALCARCTFIYLGMALAAVGLWFKKNIHLPVWVYPSFLFLFLAETGGEMAGWYSNWKWLRAVSGFVSGLLLLFFLFSELPTRLQQKGNQ